MDMKSKKYPGAGQIYEENRGNTKCWWSNYITKLKEKTRKAQREWMVQVQRAGEE